jgi:hypothetical protein
MNMVSSNINQWTMLVAMLPFAYAFALGHFGTIHFDSHQRVEILMTIGQSLLGVLLLANMRFAWWEALMLFLLWLIQFMLSGLEKPLDPGVEYTALAKSVADLISVGVTQVEHVAKLGKEIITGLYFAWSALIVIMSFTRRGFAALTIFPRLMREHW